jgi:phosphate starvation-inducible PhoH-like protein
LTDSKAERVLPLQTYDEERMIMGPYDEHARILRERFGVSIVSRNGALKLIGEEPRLERVDDCLKRILSALRDGAELSVEDIRERIQGQLTLEDLEQPAPPPAAAPPAAGPEPSRAGEERSAAPAAEEAPRFGIRIVLPAGTLEPRTEGQARYMEAIRSHAVTFAIGPAGTGKTFLAVAMAVEALRRGEFRRLVLVRPAVEAGEKLGFLPGDFQAKVNPYLRPLYDALNDLIDPQATRRYFENDVLEVVPLAFMRGRTLNSSFIILDEAQNTTVRQMMMFLTRMGYGSKIVVTGDVTQIDLPSGAASGLVDVRRRLKGIEGVAFSILERSDIVRHPLVQRIVAAYGDAGRSGGSSA